MSSSVDAAANATQIVEEVRARRAAGQLDAARTLVEAGLKRWPNAQSLHFESARILENEGRSDEAADAYRTAIDRFPASPFPAQALAWIYIRGKRADEAAAVATLACERGLEGEAALRLELAVARLRGDSEAVRAAAERLTAGTAPPSVQFLLTLANAYWNLKDAAAAERVAMRILALDPTLARAAHIAALAASELGERDRAMAHYRTLVQLEPDNVRWTLAVIRLLAYGGKVREAVQELDEVRRRWPNDPLVHVFAVRFGYGIQGLDEPDVGTVPDAAGNPRPSPGNRSAPLDDTVLKELAALRALAELAPTDAELLRPLLVDALDQDVIIAEAEGATTAVIVFTGAADKTSGVPLPVFDRYLAALGVTAIYLKDFDRLAYLSGVRSLGDDFDSMLAALGDLRHRYGALHLCTIGSSGGVIAAVRCGVELGAGRIICFAGATSPAPELIEEAHMLRKIARREATARGLRAKLRDEEMDLKPFLGSRSYASRIDFFYGQEMAKDVAHAMRISGLPGVTLHPVPGVNDHDVLRSLIVKPDFRGMFGDLIGK